MTATKTLLQLAGADLSLPRLGDACLVLIDLQNEYLAGPIALPMPMQRSRALRNCWRAPATAARRCFIARIADDPAACSTAAPNAAPSSPQVPLADEPVIEKELPNAFAGTDLQARLAATGRKNIILAGFMTHMCVSSTARAALDLASAPGRRRQLRHPRPARWARRYDMAATIHEVALAELSDRFAIIARGADALV